MKYTKKLVNPNFMKKNYMPEDRKKERRRNIPAPFFRINI
jgi:hypothetical protein